MIAKGPRLMFTALGNTYSFGVYYDGSGKWGIAWANTIIGA